MVVTDGADTYRVQMHDLIWQGHSQHPYPTQAQNSTARPASALRNAPPQRMYLHVSTSSTSNSGKVLRYCF